MMNFATIDRVAGRRGRFLSLVPCRLPLLLLCATAGLAWGAPVDGHTFPADWHPEQTVAILVNAPSGLSEASELEAEVKDALARVKEFPDAYWSALIAAVTPDTDLLAADRLYVHRVENGVAVIGLVGGVRAEMVLAESFAAWNALVEGKTLGVIAESDAIRLRNGMVTALAESGSACLVQAVLASLEDAEFDVTSYEVYMQYLQAAGGGTVGIVDKVKAATAHAGREDWPLTSQTLERLKNPSPAGGEKSPGGGESVSGGETSATDEDSETTGETSSAGRKADADFKIEPASRSIWPAVAVGAMMLAVAMFYFRRRKS